MKRLNLSLWMLSTTLVLGISTRSSFSQSLRVGDQAPPVKAMAWLKGEPVTKYTAGQVYVVEFWATWCIPCKENIPDLTALAKKYAGKVTVIGVDVRENEKAIASKPKVQAFVDKMGEKMAYTVAMDDPSTNTVFNDWMKAAGMMGIPTAFVVGRDGKLLWMGHPSKGKTELEEMVKLALSGTIDLKELRKKQELAYERERFSRDDKESREGIKEMLKAKQYRELKAVADKHAKDTLLSRKQLALREAFVAQMFLDPNAAKVVVDSLLANRNTKKFHDFLYLNREFGAYLPAFAIDGMIGSLKSISVMYYGDLAELLYLKGKREEGLKYLDEYINWKKKTLDVELELLGQLQTNRDKFL